MSTQSIHRATRTMPISHRALCDIWGNRVSPVARRVMARFTTARTSSATLQFAAPHSKSVAGGQPKTRADAASAKMNVGTFVQGRPALLEHSYSKSAQSSPRFQFASRLLLPRWQIGSLRCSTRSSHWLRGFRSLSDVVIAGLNYLSSRKANSYPHLSSPAGRLSQADQSRETKQWHSKNQIMRSTA